MNKWEPKKVMKSYDAVVVGAGPAGGQCARDLAKAGKKVLLLERAQDFSVNSYSSGGAPLSILPDYDLPQSLVSTFWDKLGLFSANQGDVWKGKGNLGVVLDFKKLREFLAHDAAKHGAEVSLHSIYLNHHATVSNDYIISIKELHSDQLIQIKSKFLVDGTGSERKVWAGVHYDKRPAMQGSAIEYLIKVPPELYDKYQNTLAFYLGLKWMPQGYAWIFPAEAPYLKAGVIRYYANKTLVPYEKNYQFYLDHLLHECLNGLNSKTAEVVDRHGKSIHYMPHNRDPLTQTPGLIIIGDATSTINPLAFEGIRHAMFSGKQAAISICQSLNGEKNTLKNYESTIRKYRGIKWRTTEYIMNYIYTLKDEKKYDQAIQSFQHFTAEEILQLGFDYKFQKLLKFYWHLGGSAP